MLQRTWNLRNLYVMGRPNVSGFACSLLVSSNVHTGLGFYMDKRFRQIGYLPSYGCLGLLPGYRRSVAL